MGVGSRLQEGVHSLSDRLLPTAYCLLRGSRGGTGGRCSELHRRAAPLAADCRRGAPAPRRILSMRQLLPPGLTLCAILLLGVPPVAAQRPAAPARRRAPALAPAATPPKPAPSAAHGNAEAIQAARLREYLTFIASDE